MTYACHHCGEPIRIRSFRLAPAHCPHCGVRRREPGRVALRSSVDIVLYLLLLGLSAAGAMVVSDLVVWILRPIPGVGNAGFGFRSVVFALAFGMLTCLALHVFPMTSGRYAPVERSVWQRCSLGLHYLARFAIASGLLVVGPFVASHLPDRLSTIAVLVLWSAWLLYFALPYSFWLTGLEWQDRPPLGE